MNAAAASQIEEQFARFPGPLTLRPARAKWLRLLVTGLIFVAFGVWAVRAPETFANAGSGDAATRFLVSLRLARDSRQAVVEVGWACLLFFGACSSLSALTLLPGFSGLRLDSDGFTVRQMFRSHAIRWRDVRDFEPVAVKYGVGALTLVGYDLESVDAGSLASMNVRLTGRNSALPDTYGLAAADLARLMTLWRQRAVHHE